MANESQKQYKINRAIAFILSIGIHIGLVVALAYTMMHTTIQSQDHELGIEMNFGADDAGEGLTQESKTENPAQPSEDKELNAFEESNEEEFTEENTDEMPEEETEQPIQEDATEEDVSSEEDLTSEAVPNSESDITASEEHISPEDSHEETPQEKEEEHAPTVDENSLLGPSSNGNNKGEKPTETVNQGNVNNAQGDQGNEKGEINAEALLNSSGGKGGSNLDMPGWMWTDTPKVNDASAETGKIVFDITIDDIGEVISVKTVTSTVSKSTEQKYIDAVYDLLFEPTEQVTDVNGTTTGRITFIITAR